MVCRDDHVLTFFFFFLAFFGVEVTSGEGDLVRTELEALGILTLFFRFSFPSLVSLSFTTDKGSGTVQKRSRIIYILNTFEIE